MIVECVNAWCNGTGSSDPCDFEVTDGELDYYQQQGFDLPRNCPSCRIWNNPGGSGSGRERMVVQCRNCRQRRHFTGGRQVWLKKREGIPAPEIERGDLCPDCLEASNEERKARREAALMRHNYLEARSETSRKLRLTHLQLRAHLESRAAEGVEYWRKRLKIAVPAKARHVHRIFAHRDGKLHADRAAASGVPVQLETLAKRLKEGDEAQRAAFNALVENPRIDHEELVKGLGRDEISPALASSLPRALSLVLAEHPNASGLLTAPPPGRGKHGPRDTSSWISDLGTYSNVDGIAYELHGTVALMQRGARSRSGAMLTLYPSDDAHFGVKLQARHAGEDSVEADLLIERGGYFSGFQSIGIDFKYSARGTYGNLSDRQLEGVRSAIRDGQVTEFHFATNGTFQPNFAKKVGRINKELAETGHPPIQLFEQVNWS